jgi:CRISPR-associated protein Cas2
MLKLICYDIENDRLRTAIAKYLEQQGLVRLQYSVFAGTLNLEQWQKLWNRVALMYEKSCKESDAIYCMILSKAAFKKMQGLGKKPDKKFILDEIEVLYL